jgi:deazaflavin-dependent oxidoreductase (nitroreductase family)
MLLTRALHTWPPSTVTAVATRTLGAIDSCVRPAAQRGWLAPGPVGLGVVELETAGRRTGRRRARPLVALRAGDRMLVGTVRPRSDWVANLRADPSASVRTRRATRRVEPDVHRCGGASLAVLRLGSSLDEPRPSTTTSA